METASIQMMMWDGKTLLTNELPDPNFILWDAEEKFCLMAYPKHFCIFETRPTFRSLVTRRVSIQSALWHERCLVYAPSTRIEAFFPTVSDKSPLLLASLDASEAEFTMNNSGTGSISIHLRPLGSISLVKISGESLYLLDASHQLHTVSLASPRVKFFLLVASGKASEAMQWMSYFPPRVSLEIAQFLLSFGFAQEATLVPHLNNFQKLEICRHHHLLPRAIEILNAIIEEKVTTTTDHESNDGSLSSPAVSSSSPSSPAVDEIKETPRGGLEETSLYSMSGGYLRPAERARKEAPNAVEPEDLAACCQALIKNVLEKEDPQTVQKIFSLVSRVDQRFYYQYVNFLLSIDHKKDVEKLYHDLVNQRRHDVAKWCGLFLGDPKTVEESFSLGSQFAELAAFNSSLSLSLDSI